MIFEERKVARVEIWGKWCLSQVRNLVLIQKTVAQIIFTDGISVVWWDDTILYTLLPSTAINKGSELERYKSVWMRARFKPQTVSRRIRLRILLRYHSNSHSIFDHITSKPKSTSVLSFFFTRLIVRCLLIFISFYILRQWNEHHLSEIKIQPQI